MKRVLVAFDGSGPARAALGKALDLALAGRAELSLVHVSTSGEDGPAVIAAAVAEARRRGIEPGVETAAGEPVAAILLTADRLDADLVVLGASNRGEGLGSVSGAVLRRCERPVLLVRGRRERPKPQQAPAETDKL